MHLFGQKLLMSAIGNALDEVAEIFAHLLRQIKPEFLLQEIADAALARLAVDADDVAVVLAPDIFRIDIKVRHIPELRMLLLAPLHALGDRVLMRARESGEDQLARIRLTRVDTHARHALVKLDKLGHIGKVQLGIDAEREEVHGKRHDVRVARALTVAEERALDALRSRQDAQLRIRHAATAVVVRMQGQSDGVAVLEILRNIGDLHAIDMRHRKLHGHGDVDDGRALRLRLPDVEHGVANFKRILRLRAREALGRILEAVVSACLRRKLRKEIRSLDGNLFDLFF